MASQDTFVCPNCGANVPARAAACPACGSDDETGWSDETIYDGLDLPDEGDDRVTERGEIKRIVWTITAIATVVVIVVLILLGAW